MRLFCIIKTTKKYIYIYRLTNYSKKRKWIRISLEPTYLLTIRAIFQPLRDPIPRRQTSKRMKTSSNNIEADKRDEAKEEGW